MRAPEAAEVLNGMQYKPGSDVVALPVDDDLVMLSVSFVSFDSTPNENWNRPATFGTPPILIRTRSLDREGVQAAGLNALLEVEAHETREFWREKNGMKVAPFHPHNRSGETAWQRTRAIPVEVIYPEPNGE